MESAFSLNESFSARDSLPKHNSSRASISGRRQVYASGIGRLLARPDNGVTVATEAADPFCGNHRALHLKQETFFPDSSGCCSDVANRSSDVRVNSSFFPFVSPSHLGTRPVGPHSGSVLHFPAHKQMSGVSRWFANLSSSYHSTVAAPSAGPPPNSSGVLGLWRPAFDNSEEWLPPSRTARRHESLEAECPPPPSCSSETSSDSSLEDDDDGEVKDADSSRSPIQGEMLDRSEDASGGEGAGFRSRGAEELSGPSLKPKTGLRLHKTSACPPPSTTLSSPTTDGRTPRPRVLESRRNSRSRLGELVAGCSAENAQAEVRGQNLRPALPPTSAQSSRNLAKRLSLRENIDRDAAASNSRSLGAPASSFCLNAPADSSSALRVAAVNQLSAQSTLESLSLHPGMNGTSLGDNAPRGHSGTLSLSAASPSSVATLSTSQGAALSSVSSRATESAATAFDNSTSASATSASLASLFACVSPYLSPADVKMVLPLTRLYDPRGPVVFAVPPLKGVRVHRGELKLWENDAERVVSQNSSNRRVHRAVWLPGAEPQCPRPAAIKFVEDANPRDGRSLKREIECHIYVYQKLPSLFQLEQELRAAQMGHYSFTHNPEWSTCERMEDAWPSAELFGYHLDKKNPGKSVLLTRKLSGPDLFDVIRAEHNHNWHFHHPSNGHSVAHKCRAVYSHHNNVASAGKKELILRGAAGGGDGCAYYPLNYEYHKLRWCALALKRIAQYASLSIRHNDVKPDNIVLDFYTTRAGHDCLDVKLIDLGTASMHNAKDFTGGTSWYESPEQKLLEYFMKKKKKIDAAKRVDIDLPSDLWGAGISLAEVLVGKRVVDALKPPHGPGALEYLGWDSWLARGIGRGAGEETGGAPPEADCRGGGGQLDNYPYWAVEPADWVGCARKALALDRENGDDRLSLEAARWIFTHLVRPHPAARMPISVAMTKLERFAEEAWKRFRHAKSSFNHAGESHKSGSNHGNAFCISPETTSASTPVTNLLGSRNIKATSNYRQQMILQAASGVPTSAKIALANALATPKPLSGAEGLCDGPDGGRSLFKGILPGSASKPQSVFGRARRLRCTKDNLKTNVLVAGVTGSIMGSTSGLDDDVKNWLGVS